MDLIARLLILSLSISLAYGSVTKLVPLSAKTDKCLQEPCGDKGVCVEDTTIKRGFTCQCKIGYTGDMCEKEVEECDSMPCKNDAACVATPEGFHCVCTNGYAGKRCKDYVGRGLVQDDMFDEGTTPSNLLEKDWSKQIFILEIAIPLLSFAVIVFGICVVRERRHVKILNEQASENDIKLANGFLAISLKLFRKCMCPCLSSSTDDMDTKLHEFLLDKKESGELIDLDEEVLLHEFLSRDEQQRSMYPLLEPKLSREEHKEVTKKRQDHLNRFSRRLSKSGSMIRLPREIFNPNLGTEQCQLCNLVADQPAGTLADPRHETNHTHIPLMSRSPVSRFGDVYIRKPNDSAHSAPVVYRVPDWPTAPMPENFKRLDQNRSMVNAPSKFPSTRYSSLDNRFKPSVILDEWRRNTSFQPLVGPVIPLPSDMNMSGFERPKYKKVYFS